MSLIFLVLSCMKNSKSHKVNTKCDAYALMDCLWEAVESCQEDTESAVDSSKLFFIAEKSRNEDFLVDLLKRDHNLLYKVNVFHVAVLNRFVKVCNLMDGLGGTKDFLVTYIDDEGRENWHLHINFTASLAKLCKCNGMYCGSRYETSLLYSLSLLYLLNIILIKSVLN